MPADIFLVALATLILLMESATRRPILPVADERDTVGRPGGAPPATTDGSPSRSAFRASVLHA